MITFTLKMYEFDAILAFKYVALMDFQVLLVVKNLSANAGDLRDGVSISGWGRPWKRIWEPTQDSCLENPMDRGAWWATVYRVTKS